MRQPARKEPGTKIAGILAIAVHLLFVGLLIFGVDWKTHEPEAVIVDLWNRLPSPKTSEVVTPEPPKETPPPETKPEPKLEPKPAPRAEPKVIPKPEPKAKPKADSKPEPSKADIQLKDKQEREKARQLQEDEDKKKQLLAAKEKQAKDKKAAQEKLTAEKKIQDESNKAAQQLAQQASAKVKKQSDEYVRRIHDKIKALIVIPPDLVGNPQAEFDVVQLPTGEVLEIRLTKSSGQKAYDNAVERAISKANPLPQPPDPSMFQRELTLKFRPNE